MNAPTPQTPRTDALFAELGKDCDSHHFLLDHSRTLEKELSEAKADLNRYAGVIKNRNERVDGLLLDSATLQARVQELENLTYSTHSCGEHCQKIECKQRREIQQLTTKVELLEKQITCDTECIERITKHGMEGDLKIGELTAQIAVKDEALKMSTATFKSDAIKYSAFQWRLETIEQLQNALTNSPTAAKELLEQHEKMRKFITDSCCEDITYPDGSVVTKQQVLSTTQG